MSSTLAAKARRQAHKIQKPAAEAAAKKIAEAISKATKNGAISIVGGGDTSAFVIDFLKENPESAEFSLVSTGGGAALELMSGEILPGLEALQNK